MSKEQQPQLFQYRITWGLTDTKERFTDIIEAPSEMDAEIHAYNLAYDLYIRPVKARLISSAEPVNQNDS